MAQGNLLVSGLSADGKDGSKVSVNVPNVGRIPRAPPWNGKWSRRSRPPPIWC